MRYWRSQAASREKRVTVQVDLAAWLLGGQIIAFHLDYSVPYVKRSGPVAFGKPEKRQSGNVDAPWAAAGGHAAHGPEWSPHFFGLNYLELP
jgi:hypothetical protein